jgi:hypothetical protein
MDLPFEEIIGIIYLDGGSEITKRVVNQWYDDLDKS